MRRSGAAHAMEVAHSKSGSYPAASRAAVLGTATSMELPVHSPLLGTECARRGVALPPGPSCAAAPVSSS